MKRILLLTVATLLLGLLLGSVVLAQGTTELTAATVTETTPAGDLAPSGGQSILLPAAALLLGTGVLTYAIFRRLG